MCLTNSQVFSHIAVICTSCLGINRLIFSELSIPIYSYATLILFIGHSVVGIIRLCVSEERKETFENVFDSLGFIQTSLALPCVNASLWLNYGYDYVIADVHVISAMAPPLIYFIDIRNGKSILRILATLNVYSLAIISLINGNGWGAVATLFYIIYPSSNEIEGIGAPLENVCNVCLCLFGQLSLEAILHSLKNANK